MRKLSVKRRTWSSKSQELYPIEESLVEESFGFLEGFLFMLIVLFSLFIGMWMDGAFI